MMEENLLHRYIKEAYSNTFGLSRKTIKDWDNLSRVHKTSLNLDRLVARKLNKRELCDEVYDWLSEKGINRVSDIEDKMRELELIT